MGGDPPQPRFLQALLRQTAALEVLHEHLARVVERGDRESLLKRVADAIASDENDESPVKQTTSGGPPCRISAAGRTLLEGRCWRCSAVSGQGTGWFQGAGPGTIARILAL